MNLKYVCDVKYELEVLEERVINDFEFNSKMIAESMQEASTSDIWRIVIDFVVVIPAYFWVYVLFEKLLAFFWLYKEEIEEIYEIFFEFLQELPIYQFLLVYDFVKSSKKVSFARTSNHLGFQHFFIELKIYFLCQRTYVTYVYAVLMQNIFNTLTVNQKNSRII